MKTDKKLLINGYRKSAKISTGIDGAVYDKFADFLEIFLSDRILEKYVVTRSHGDLCLNHMGIEFVSLPRVTLKLEPYYMPARIKASVEWMRFEEEGADVLTRCYLMPVGLFNQRLESILSEFDLIYLNREREFKLTFF